MKKRSINIAGHATSVSMEEEFWRALKSMATEQDISVNQLVALIDENRTGNLSSALRLHVLHDLQGKVARLTKN